MPPAKSDAPAFWIIAGPNTFISDPTWPFWIINPDLLASRIRSTERLSSRTANVEAVKRIEAWLEASIDAHQSIGVETVLSTDKYRRLVQAAKSRGFEIRLVYVILQNPELNVERVKLRVRKGGHSVPVRKILDRWGRSLGQLPWFLGEADWALLFDNSKELRVIGRKEKGTVTLDPDAPAAVREAIQKIQVAENK